MPVAILSSAPAGAQKPPQQCADTAEKKAKRSMFGGMLSSLGGGLLGRAGRRGQRRFAGAARRLLSDGRALEEARLQGTDAGRQGDRPGGSRRSRHRSRWKSDSRANVTGKSTVTGEEKLADGGQCLTVTDVVIVDGEETTVPKRMCKAKGASGYARV